MPMKSFIYIAALSLALISPRTAAAEDFNTWVNTFKAEASSKGISAETLNAAFEGITPIPRVIELDRKQPEGRLTLAKYHENVVNDTRIQKGRRLFKEHRAELDAISQQYGVQPQYIVALWGIETNYGGYTGGTNTIRALSTLAHDGRRSAFFRKELMNALTIIDEGHITAADMKGSWAGALGQNQFMPSSFLAYAVDQDGDGKKDIWSTYKDIFASSSNYLARSGWKGDERWGREVKIPANMPKDFIGSKQEKPMIVWQQLGVTNANGSPLSTDNSIKAALIQPDGAGGKAYLTYDNFKTIMKWNRSTYFATSVGLLADAIAQ